MEANVPLGFMELADVQKTHERGIVSCIGVVVDAMPPTLTRTGDEMVTVQITDPSIRDTMDIGCGLKIRVFRKPNDSTCPELQTLGDIVAFRNVRVNIVNGERLAINTHSTEVLVFPAKSIPELSFSLSYINNANQKLTALGNPRSIERLTGEEQAYVISLKHKLHDVVAGLNVQSATESSVSKRAAVTELQSAKHKKPKTKMSSFGPKFSLVEDLEHYQFVDLVVEVVKTFADYHGNCDLYVTDYTSNKELYHYQDPEEGESEMDRDGDEYGYNAPTKKAWKGPYGQLVLKVNVKQPHASYVNKNVRDGSIVLLRNVKMKTGQNSANARLEGDMFPDWKWRERIDVSLLKKGHTAPELGRLFERKDKYWAARKPQGKSDMDVQQQLATLTRSQRKRAKASKKKKAEAARNNDQPGEGANGQNSTGEAKAGISTTVNQHVRSNHADVPISPLMEILDSDGRRRRHKLVVQDVGTVLLPYVNCRIRAKVRVVDFEPKNLEEWAIPTGYDTTDDSLRSIDAMEIEASQQYEWNFALVLEDMTSPNALGVHREQIKVQVHHEHAQYLLGNDMPDPQDLSTHPMILAKLRLKMSTLWGDLEESRGKWPPKNVPFECCIQEYGCKIDDDDFEALTLHPYGWIKFYELFGTTIL